MTEREYLLAQLVTASKAVMDISTGLIPVRGVATERELRVLRRTAIGLNMRAHAALNREAPK